VIAAIVPITLGGLFLFAFWFWAILDCVSTDNILVRNLPKTTWLFVIIIIPMAGAIAWLLLGRPEGAGMSVGGGYRPPDYTRRERVRGYEDSADWKARSKNIKPVERSEPSESTAAKERRLLEWEAELKKREDALDNDSDT